MEYKLELIRSLQALHSYRGAILKLFRECFHAELSEALWEWAYLHNPCGQPFMCVAVKDGELVGHYAGIPQIYANSSGAGTFLLSMTTMVHPQHRVGGLFPQMAEICYGEAESQGIKGVLGFPNKNSTPGFKKRLQWVVCDTFLDTYDLSEVPKPLTAHPGLRLVEKDEFLSRYEHRDNRYSLALDNEKLLHWRLSKPGNRYFFARYKENVFILKEYKRGLDVVFSPEVDEEVFLQLLQYAKHRSYSTLSIFSLGSQVFKAERIAYPFGYRLFRGVVGSFCPSLIMSDVF